MQNRTSIQIYKLLTKTPFIKSSKHTTTIFSRSLTIPSNQKRLHFYHPQTKNTQTHSKIFQNITRSYSVNTDREVDTINLKFAEAREEIESAMDSKETVYFNEEAECARAAVAEVLELYDGLLNKLQDSEKSAIQRGMGLKMEQLKAELAQLNE